MTIDNLIIGKRYAVSSNSDCVITDTASGYTLATISAGVQAVIVPISSSITSDNDCVVLPISNATVTPTVGQGGNGGDTGASYVTWGGDSNTEVTLAIPDDVDIPLSFYSRNITSIQGTTGGMTDCESLCSSCSKLTSVNLDMPNAQDCGALFYNCNTLTSLNLDLPNATDCESLCSSCKKLTSVNLNLPNAVYCSSMCNNDSALTSLSVDLPSAIYCGSLCSSCGNLTSLNLTAPNATNCSSMCNWCYKLESVSIDAPKATNCSSMCNSCNVLTDLTISLASMSQIDCTSHSSSSGLGNLSSLVNVTIIDGGLASCKSFKISNSNNLSAESVQNIVDALPDLTGQTAGSVYFPAGKVSAEQEEQLTAKNWSSL